MSSPRVFWVPIAEHEDYEERVADSELRAGSVVHGRYRLLERVGGGGMGHVFRAEDATTGRVVAIKLLLRELSNNADVTARLFQEATVLKTIAHPNIVEILSVDTSEHGPYITMEYLDGASVGSLLSTMGRFDESTVATIMIPLLAALDAAHASGAIHRDLKPENMFVCRERDGFVERGDVHLLDFGIAKLCQVPAEGRPRTRTGIVFGTPDYLSPEQATGEGALDGRSDLFSVGIVMYELLSGRRPFTASTAVATAFRIVHATPPSFESLGLTVSPEMRGVVRKLLAKAPADRPATAREAMQMLLSFGSDSEQRSARLLRLLSEAEDKRRRGSRPPPLASRDKSSPPLGVEAITTRAHSLSPRTHGRCARGPVLASLDGSLERTRGEMDRERVVALLPDSHAEELRRGSPSLLDAFDIDVVRRYVETAARVLQLSEDAFVAFGREAIDHELAPFVRTLTRPFAGVDGQGGPRPQAAGDMTERIPRMITIVRALFDFGTWTVTHRDETVTPPGARSMPERPAVRRHWTIRVTGYDIVPRYLRLWLVGVVSAILDRAAAGVDQPSVREIRTEDQSLEIEVMANP